MARSFFDRVGAQVRNLVGAETAEYRSAEAALREAVDGVTCDKPLPECELNERAADLDTFNDSDFNGYPLIAHLRMIVGENPSIPTLSAIEAAARADAQARISNITPPGFLWVGHAAESELWKVWVGYRDAYLARGLNIPGTAKDFAAAGKAYSKMTTLFMTLAIMRKEAAIKSAREWMIASALDLARTKAKCDARRAVAYREVRAKNARGLAVGNERAVLLDMVMGLADKAKDFDIQDVVAAIQAAKNAATN